VELTLKGPASPTVEALDVASLINDRQGPISGKWGGSGGSCGAFDVDPTGKYVFLALVRAEDGTLRTSLPLTFFVGERYQFAGSLHERLRDHMSSFGLIIPPSTGSAGLVQHGSTPGLIDTPPLRP
jgi:hypothetical protein